MEGRNLVTGGEEFGNRCCLEWHDLKGWNGDGLVNRCKRESCEPEERNAVRACNSVGFNIKRSRDIGLVGHKLTKGH